MPSVRLIAGFFNQLTLRGDEWCLPWLVQEPSGWLEQPRTYRMTILPDEQYLVVVIQRDNRNRAKVEQHITAR
jgi:hypothetical protein